MNSLLRIVAFVFVFVFQFASLSSATENTELKSNHISLPSGPGSLEGLGKTFEPSLNTGGASYSVDFALPAGTAGHTPNLSLNYSSGFGMGVAGLGWQLSVPSIERSLENGQPQYSDADVLTYQGETLVALTDASYAPAMQTGFIRFKQKNNGFIAEDKAGNTLEFGSLIDNNQEANVASEGPDVRQFHGTYRWYLTRSTDAKGQSTEYLYQRPSSDDGKIYLTEVRYGQQNGPYNRVVFHYEQRPDQFYSYQEGFQCYTRQRLSQVDVYHGTRLLWQYSLSYEYNEQDDLYPQLTQAALDSGFSLLKKVTRWNAEKSVSLPPLRFDYSRIYSQDQDLPPLNNFPGPEDVDINHNGVVDTNRASELQGLPAGVNVIGQQASFTDITGDALPDWLFWKSGQYQYAKNLGYVEQGSDIEFAAAQSLNHAPVAPLDDPAVHLIDLDGDGQADFLHRISSTRWLYYRNRGNGEFSPAVAYPSPASIVPGNTSGDEDQGVRFADINLDSRIDIVSANGRYWRYCLNGPGQPDAAIYGHTTYDQDLAPFDNFPSAEDIDLNGNGRIDLPAWQCSGSINTGLPADINLTNDAVQLRDMNGDRLQDVVAIRAVNQQLQVQYWPNTGLLDFAEPVLVQNAPSLAGLIRSRFELQDINGDGLSDLVYQQSGQLRFWLQQLTDSGPLWGDAQGLATPTYSRTNTALMSGDFNGNGTQDFAWVSVSGVPAPQYLDISGDQKAHILNTIDNGMGLRTVLNFQSMGAMQAEANRAGMPWQSSSPVAQQIVSQRTYLLPLDTTGNGDNDTIVQTYRYRDAYYDPYRKQFRGFAFARVETLGDSDVSTQVSRHFFHTGAADGQDNDGDGQIDEREPDGSSEELPLKGKTRRLEQTNRAVDLADNQAASAEQLVQAQQTDWQIRRIHTLDTDVASMSGKEVSFAEMRNETIFYHELSRGDKASRKSYQYDDWGNLIRTDDYGLLDDINDDKIIHNQFALHPNGIFQLPQATQVTDANGETLQSSRMYYDGLALGQITRGLVSKEEKWKSASDWITSQKTQYDAVGNPIMLTDADGRQRQLVWDSVWRAFPVEEWIYAEGSGKAPLTIRADYDTGLGVLTTHTGFNNEKTQLAYDDFGRLLTIQKPYESEPSVNYSYHFVDPFRNHEYQFSADGQQRVANNTDSTSFVYTSLIRDDGRREEVKQHIDGLGRELATYTLFEQGYIVTGSKWFDHQGRERKTFRPWITSLSTYVLPTNDLIATELTLDAHGRPLTEEYPADEQGRRSLMQYQYRPREVLATDPQGFQSKQTLNAEDQVLTLSQQQEVNNVLGWYQSVFLYDPLGRLTKITDAQGNVKQQWFNGLDQKTRQSDLDQGVTEYRYDNSGNLLQKTDQLGRNLYYRYDQAARLTQIFDNDYRSLYQYHYDAPQQAKQASGYLGKLTWVDEYYYSSRDASDSASANLNSEHYHYDLRGNLIHKTRQLDGVGYQFHYQYDAQDRIRRQIWPDGDHVDYQYDLRGKVNRIGDLITNVSYDADGQVNTLYYANGTQQSRDYDDKGQLTELNSSGRESLTLLSYQYDLRGNMTRSEDILNSRNSQVFQYDAISQLKNATGSYGQLRYQYDAIGNMTAKFHNPVNNTNTSPHQLGDMGYGSSAGTQQRLQKGAMPGPHAITSASDGRFWRYNALGQRTEDHAGNVYHWDQLGRLTQWQRNVPLQGAATDDEEKQIVADEQYLYDYKGRRLKKASRGLDNNGQLVAGKRVYYVDKSYEIRDDIAQKHISIGNLRVARLQTPIAQALAQIHEYSLNPGWNQIFLNRTPQGRGIWDQLSSDNNSGLLRSLTRQFVTFDAGQQRYQQYQRNNQSQSGDLSQLQGNKAYWVYLASQADVTYPLIWQIRADIDASEADNSERFAKRLNAGWNHTRLPLDRALTTNNDIERFMAATAIERLWWYQQSQDRWYSWVKGQDNHSLTELNPEAIYWVYSSREHIIARASGINSQRFFLHNNHLGSVAFETDINGNITQSSNYQPYGAAQANRDQSGNKVSTYSFSGKEQDGSGLYYFEARYYDPVTTRFISPDPLFAVEMEKCIESIIECNLYQYTGNNPVVFVDPSGLESGYWSGQEQTPVNVNMSEVATTVADFTPGLSNIKAADEARTGEQWFTGSELSNFDRGVAAASVIGGAITKVAGKVASGVNKVAKGLAVPGNLPKNIHPGQQGKHIPGHNNFTPGRSPLADGVNPQKLLDGVHRGEHPIVRMTPREQPVVDFGEAIGQFEGEATNFGIIHHGKKGAHIVPANPVQF